MAATDVTLRGVAALVINYNTSQLTARCVRSLLEAGVARVLVLDNASAADDYRSLAEAIGGDGRVRLARSQANLGFAQGSNLLIDDALVDPGCERVLLLNSDAVVEPAGLATALGAMAREGHDLMGGRMLKPAAGSAPREVDSLGITLYKCLLASNRKSPREAYLGPTGGFAIYSRAFLEEARSLHGYVFDPEYFCYAEDTDLCVRARLLGRSAGYVDDVVAYHEGQGSHGGERDEFILYYGIRNSIWMAAKTIPAWILVTQLPWLIALHGGIILRHTLRGRWGTLWRLYRDAAKGLPGILERRRAVQASRRITTRQFRVHIDPQFYEPAYLEGALRDLYRR